MTTKWKVLLIGGSSATGKSVLARQLASHYQTTLTEVDDIRIALQQKVSKVNAPNLFFFLDNSNFLTDFPLNLLVKKLLTVATELEPSLSTLIQKHIDCDEPIVFEGDGILPQLAAKYNKEEVKSVFIYDAKENIKERELSRKSGVITRI
jgi:2-phosphoglycerate kinase